MFHFHESQIKILSEKTEEAKKFSLSEDYRKVIKVQDRAMYEESIQFINLGVPWQKLFTDAYTIGLITRIIFLGWAINVGINARKEIKMEKRIINVAMRQD